ncbi:DEAD/DEAH box helicase family protein [Moraxella sp. K127]|uniref:helicase-related protein n=1 Tax=Moraxella TaxID=475 RepID=UPI00187FE7D1|nr:helicase-related protein [Moraxella sp. K127]MBE9590578.1 DEAD/DEAH box helicase family protein [Moraxella sp. K127]
MTLIDNINHLLADEIKQHLNSNTQCKFIGDSFSIYAYETLKEHLNQLQSFDFIFSSSSFEPVSAVAQDKKEKREFFIPKPTYEKSLYGSEFEIHLKNKLNQKAIAKECANWIRQKATFKSNISNQSIQNFCILKYENHHFLYTPISQGFTPVGLGLQKSNALSNFVYVMNDTSAVKQHEMVFDQLWCDPTKAHDVSQEIVRHIESVYQENDPQRIYFLALYHLFKEFLDDSNEDNLPNDKTGYQNTLIWQKLFEFQKDAVIGIINKLEKFNGCILADSVGLGKTFSALAVIKYYELRNKSVLVLCPKKLSDNWTSYNTNVITNIFAKDRFNYDVLYHTDLSRTSGHTLGMDLSKINWGNYDLLVIDESHNFRNKEYFKDKETRYDHLMNKIIRQGVKTKVLMLSATPVNNKFNDLKNQLALAYEGDSSLLEDKLDINQSIDTIFRKAQTAFNEWTKLPPEYRTTDAILNKLELDFFKLLDSVTIARSRKHIQTFYDTKAIGKFPTRHKPLSYRCGISVDNNIALNDIYTLLASIKMTVYAPMGYILPSRLAQYAELFDTTTGTGSRFRQADREKSLQSLMTVNLLKRLESSIHAFRLTLTKMKTLMSDILGQIDDFHRKQIGSGEVALPNIDDDDEDMIGGVLKIRLDDMDTRSFERALKDDMAVIDELLSLICHINTHKDVKLQQLIAHITHKIQNPINPDNKKVIVFTAFADTADYLYETVSTYFLTHFGLHTAKITGTNNHSTLGKMPNSQKSYDLQGLLTLFSPQSKQKADIFPNESRAIDILIATDCISEGQNLQDCDYLINYDIHWNPVRIIQRFGRIDRIGSPNDSIQLVNYWPDISLDEYINLKERVENRMAIVDMTSTGDDDILKHQSHDMAYRKEQLKRLQNEVLDLEDVGGGVSITDLGLNDFRMELLAYLDKHPAIKRLPHGLHTVIPHNDEYGLSAGVVFVLKLKNAKKELGGQNPLYPYFVIYLNKAGEILYNHTKAKHLLDLLAQACRHTDTPITSAYELFNERTKDGRDMSEYSALLDNAIAHIQDRQTQSDIDSLFGSRHTQALEHEISGLNDFELINFFVIE